MNISLFVINHTKKHENLAIFEKNIKTNGSESQPRKVELASSHKKRDGYREYFTHDNEACKNPYKTTLLHRILVKTFHGFHRNSIKCFSAYISPQSLKLASITLCCLLHLQHKFWLKTVVLWQLKF